MSRGPARVPLDSDDLLAHTLEQLDFILSSTKSYDLGASAEAKRMATNIRILLHSTKRSHALLTQVGMGGISFVDGGEVPNPANLLTTAGLTGLHVVAGPDGGARWVPRCALPSAPAPGSTDFVRWWTRPVLVDDQCREISRRDLVLTMSNQDGGAHVDPALDETYSRLRRQNSIGWSFVRGLSSSPVLGVEFASVRQIAQEVLVSVARVLPIERNAGCPCGTARKFKKCHGRSVGTIGYRVVDPGGAEPLP